MNRLFSLVTTFIAFFTETNLPVNYRFWQLKNRFLPSTVICFFTVLETLVAMYVLLRTWKTILYKCSVLTFNFLPVLRAMAVYTFLDSTIFSRWHGGALNYSTAPHRSKTTLISYGVFCLLESKILSIGQTLLYSLASPYPWAFWGPRYIMLRDWVDPKVLSKIGYGSFVYQLFSNVNYIHFKCG
jgi:hypothetical protein